MLAAIARTSEEDRCLGSEVSVAYRLRVWPCGHVCNGKSGFRGPYPSPQRFSLAWDYAEGPSTNVPVRGISPDASSQPAVAITPPPPPSTSGPGRGPFKAVARVRIPLGALGRP